MLVLALAASATASAEVVSVDIGEWPSATEVVTLSEWTVCGIDLYQADMAVTFNAMGDYAVSPEFQGPVTQLVVSVYSTQPVLLRNLMAIPETAGDSARTWKMECTPETKYVEQSFAWSVDEDVRRFRLQIQGSQSGNWRIRSLTVYVDRIDPPRKQEEELRYSDALPVSWEPEARAASYEVSAASVTTVLPAFRLLERWDFSVLTNETGNPLGFERVPGAETLVGVSGEHLNVQAHSGGYLQAGNTTGGGKFRFDLASAGRRTALMRMYRSAASGTDGPVVISAVSAGGVTNKVAEPLLTTTAEEFQTDLPEDASALLIETEVKNRRIRVEDVKIVTDYVPGCVTTNETPAVRTSRHEFVMRGLCPGDWLWHVRSVDREGGVSLWTPYRPVTLEAEWPLLDRSGFAVIVK